MAGKATKKKGETSAETFVRLAESRMTKAIRALRTLRSLGYYDHTQTQTTKMVEALGSEVNAIESALKEPKTARKAEGFSF